MGVVGTAELSVELGRLSTAPMLRNRHTAANLKAWI